MPHVTAACSLTACATYDVLASYLTIAYGILLLVGTLTMPLCGDWFTCQYCEPLSKIPGLYHPCQETAQATPHNWWRRHCVHPSSCLQRLWLEAGRGT